MKRRLFFLIHSWLGLTAGLMLFVICWSGTIAVFSHELDWLLNPTLRAQASTSPIQWQAVYNVVRETYPDWTIQEINAPHYSGFAIEVLAQPPSAQTHRIYIDPAVICVIDHTSYFNVQRFFRSLHMALFDADFVHILGISFGKFVVTAMSITLLASTLSVFVFYRRWYQRFFKLQSKKGARVFWSDIHKLTGLWSLWFVLLIALTGLWYMIEYWTPEPDAINPPVNVSNADNPPVLLSQMVKNAYEIYPNLSIKRFTFYDYHRGVVVAAGDDGSLLVRTRAAFVAFDAGTGNALQWQKPSDLNPYYRWIETADPLHFGNFAGLLSKTVYFLFGLGLSGLCLTGAYLQAKRQQRCNKIPHHRIPIITAYAITIVLLLIASVYGFEEINAYSADGGWPQTTCAVTVFITAWVAVTLAVLTVWMRAVR